MTRPIGELSQRLGIEIQDLSGTHVSGTVPVADALVNRLVARYLSTSESIVTGVTVEAHDGDAITAHVTLRQRFIPALTVRAQIDRQPDLPRSAVVGVRWSLAGLGPLSGLAARAIERAQTPPWIRLEPGVASVDLEWLLAEGGYGEILPHVARLRVNSTEGRIVVSFELRVGSGLESQHFSRSDT